MKICYFFADFYHSHLTGQTGIIYRLLKKAAERGERVSVVSNTLGNDRVEDKDVFDLFLAKGKADYKSYLPNFFGIMKFIKNQQSDVIHAHGLPMIIFASVLSKALNIPLVCSACENLDARILNPFFKKLLIFSITRAEILFVTSESTKKQFIENGVPQEKIILTRIGLADRFLNTTNSLPSSSDILYFGDSLKDRGFDIIYELAKRSPNLTFKVLLRWEGEDCASELKEMKKLKNVNVWHYPYSEILEHIILRSKLVVLPYRWMAVRPPVSLIESMALGKCVITSPMDGNDELVRNGYNGMIIATDNKDAFSSTVSSLIADEKKRHRLGQQARTTIKEMYCPEEYDKILNFYHTIETHQT